MLTKKKECEKALDHFEKCYWDQDNSYSAMNGVRKDLDILNELINEHFDNPPLKFEELEEKTWYWHEPSKSWIYLYKPLDWEPIKGLRYAERIIINSVEGYYMDFKENTLFRKQVE